MLPDRASNPGPLTYKSDALPIARQSIRFILSHTFRFSQASHYSERKPRLILIADINTLKHVTCTAKVLHIMNHSIMVLVMAYDVKGSTSAFTIGLSLHQQLSSISYAISECYKIEKEKKINKQPFAF